MRVAQSSSVRTTLRSMTAVSSCAKRPLSTASSSHSVRSSSDWRTRVLVPSVSQCSPQRMSRRFLGTRQKKIREYTKWVRERNKKIAERMSSEQEVVKVDQQHAVPLEEAVARVCRLSRLTIDETVELEVQLNLNHKRGNEYIRGNVVLPHGSGKSRRVCVFIPDEFHDRARQLGADVVGDDDLIKRLGSGEKPSFDVCIATPDFLRKLVPIGRFLGPLGLMPNPKMGTLTADPLKAIEAAKQGQVPVRMIEKGIIQGRVGKVSMGERKVLENIVAFVEQLRDDLRPPGAKSQYFLKCFLSSSQGRSFQVLVNEQDPWKKTPGRR